MKHLVFILVISFSSYLSAQNSEWATSVNPQLYSHANNNNVIKRIILDAYQKEFGYDPKYDLRYTNISAIHFDEIESMCHGLINSDTCSETPEEKRLKCDNLEEMSDFQVTAYQQAGFGNALGDMLSEVIEIGGAIFTWTLDTSSNEKIAQANKVIDRITTAVGDNIRERYEPTKRIIPFYNIAGRGIAWTGALAGTVASGVEPMFIDPIKEAYQAYTTRHCLNIEARAGLIAQLTTGGLIEAAIFFIGGPMANGTRRTAHLLDKARKFVGRTHKDALIEIFEKSDLTSIDIRNLVKGGDIDSNSIQDEEARQQLRELITEYLVQKHPDIPESHIVGSITPNDTLDVLQEIEVLDRDGNPVDYINEVIDKKRQAQQTRQEGGVNFGEQVRNRVIGRVHITRGVQETFDALHIETVKEKLQDFIAALNIQDRLIRTDRLRPYMPPRSGFNLVDTDAQHAHINRGHPTYVVCYRLEDDIINLFFFGTHEEAGLSYDACKI